jgi:vacuolar iron transporter family protein
MRREFHHTQRTSWLRAAVLGADDGVLSTASLIIGVASAQASRSEVLIAGIAGLMAGAMAMAAGEYVSVSSQADTEKADLDIERKGLEIDDAGERAELAEIYVKRGLEEELAGKVANQLMAFDALGAHARDELGITETLRARPLQAALASATSFSVGGVMPLFTAVTSPRPLVAPLVAAASLLFLTVLGALAARAGGASVVKGAARVLLWGSLAMALTASVGALFGARI